MNIHVIGMYTDGHLLPRLIAWSSCFLLWMACVPLRAQQNPRALVSAMVQNELSTQKTPHYWIYLDRKTAKGKSSVNRIVQTRECWFTWPISGGDRNKARHDIEQLVNDPHAREKNRKDIDEDSTKANALLTILPDAFLFTPSGNNKGAIVLKFRPNPNYKPPSNEAKVFHAMAGVLVINAKEKRLAKLSGQLQHDVDFGHGILGKIDKGGTFSVVQSEVAPGDWELTMLDVHIQGKALFFHAINEQQHELMMNFKPVPEGIDLKRAAGMVEGTQEQAVNKK